MRDGRNLVDNPLRKDAFGQDYGQVLRVGIVIAGIKVKEQPVQQLALGRTRSCGLLQQRKALLEPGSAVMLVLEV